jgi:hypothetical protein
MTHSQLIEEEDATELCQGNEVCIREQLQDLLNDFSLIWRR